MSVDLRQHKIVVVSWSVEVLRPGRGGRLRWTLGLECGHTVQRVGHGSEVTDYGYPLTSSCPPPLADGRQFTWRPAKVSCEVCTGKRAAPSG